MNVSRLPYRTRLTLVYTAVFAAALLAFGGVAYATVHWALAASLEARLQTTATAIRAIPDVRHGRIALDPEDRLQFVGLLDENHVRGAAIARDGTILVSNVQTPAQAILAAIPASSEKHATVQADYATVDIVSFPIVSQHRVLGYVAAWEPRTVYEVAARTTLLALSFSGVLIIALAVLIGGVLVARMLQPIADLNDLMSAIEASDLSERLAWDGPDDELGRLCSTFDRLLSRLEAAFESERRFTSDASHELRTPLSVMRAEVELALSRERNAETYRTTLQRLRSETYRLEALVESLLRSARQDAGRAGLVPVPLGEIAERAASRIDGLAAKRGIGVSIDATADVRVRADPHLIESALLAVLDNAVRHTPDAGRVRVSVDRADERAVLAVVDGGPGFSEAALQHATERFWRDDPSRTRGGTGLGLSIVKSIVERYGGTIDLKNGAQGGIVELRLPASYDPAKSGVIGNTAGSSA